MAVKLDKAFLPGYSREGLAQKKSARPSRSKVSITIVVDIHFLVYFTDLV